MQPLSPIMNLRTYRGRYLSVLALARYVGTTRRTIYNHIDKGALPVVKIGGVLRVRREDALVYCGDVDPQLST